METQFYTNFLKACTRMMLTVILSCIGLNLALAQVGVNTNTPDANFSLTVDRTDYSGGILVESPLMSDIVLKSTNTTNFSTAPEYRIRTTYTANSFEIGNFQSGSYRYTFRMYGNGGTVLGNSTFAPPNDGLRVVGSAVREDGQSTWDAPSDGRLKENIKTYEDGLTSIMQVKPVTFNYTTESGMNSDQSQIGIIAQELKQIAPYMVSSLKLKESDQQEYLMVNSSAFPYMLINAVQDQQEMIEQLQQEIKELTAQVSEILN